jgi:CheY-like chemotaxis protein
MQQTDSPPQLPNVARPGSALRPRIGSILLVDDYDDARACVREALEAEGHRVIEAVNGQQALNFLVSGSDERVALIILDLQMPVMDGWHFMELLRCYVGLSNIPVLVATGAPDPHLQKVAHKGIVGCIQAPYELEALVDRVNSVLYLDDTQTGANEGGRRSSGG